MKRILTAVVLIPVVLLLVFKAPLWLFALGVAGLIILTLREYLDIVEAAGIKPFRWLTYAASVLPIIVFLSSLWPSKALEFFYPELIAMRWSMLVPLLALVFGIPLVFRKDLREGYIAVAASVFGVLYIGVSLSLLINLQRGIEITFLIFLLLSVWAGDIAAYYVGKNFGKHKLAPIVSPNKSWEGAVASIVASIAVAFLTMHFRPQLIGLVARMHGLSDKGLDGHLLPSIGLIPIICLGIATNVAAQFGDLFESALKRGAGVKDSGTILPGHGGILDRIDALLFAIPVVWWYAQLAPFLRS
ncbi:MAG TPA: phosphatidate cytidylyltransferase [Candidatus Angelobacter sp.]|jgi:phosphatidate cytidylyltransferase